MSASREKKQRQGAGPDPRAVKVQQEQAAQKRQTIIYSVTGGVIALLVIALLVWRSGFFQSRAAAASIGGETLTTAELGYYYHSIRQSTAYYAAYGLSTFDGSKPDDEQFADEASGQTYRDYFMQVALNNAQQQLALAREAEKQGHTEAEIKDDLAAQIAQVQSDAASAGYSYGAYLKAMYGSYMTSGIFEKLCGRYLMAVMADNEKHEELYNSYTDADLDAYYEANADDLDTIEYSYLYFPVPSVDTKDEEGNELDEAEVDKLKEEAKAETLANAREALEAVKGGSSFDSQMSKYELTSGADHATVVGTGSLNSNYSDQLLALGKDQCDMVEMDNGCYVISFHGRYLDTTPTRDFRHILATAATTVDDSGNPVEPIDAAWDSAKAKIEQVQDAWNASSKTEDDFARLANENSDDGDGTTGGLYTKNAVNGGLVTEVHDWVFDSARSYGDVGMVQHVAIPGTSNPYYGYHLIFYVGENDPVWMDTARDALAHEAQEEWLNGLTAALPVTEQSGAGYYGS